MVTKLTNLSPRRFLRSKYVNRCDVALRMRKSDFELVFELDFEFIFELIF